MTHINRIELLQAVSASLFRIHCLSQAIKFMVTADSKYSGSTFCASIEEVNDCLHEAFQNAINHLENIQKDARNGGAA